MGKLLYAIATSLDGYVADKNGNFDWAMPNEEVHTCFNDIMKNVGTSLFGRNMYQIMEVWDTIPSDGDSPAMNDFAKAWATMHKIVYSASLPEVATTNTTLERSFDPSIIQKLVIASDKDFAIGGPHLAASAIKAGIIDDYHQIIAPTIVGGGNYWLPTGLVTELELIDARTFNNGFVQLHYRKKA